MKKIVHRVDASHTIYVGANEAFYVTQKEIDGEVQVRKFWLKAFFKAFSI